MAHPTIHIGSTGPEVKLAQEALAKRGYSPGPLDGLFGPQTKKAVLRYQTDRRLPWGASGLVWPGIWLPNPVRITSRRPGRMPV